MNTEDKIEYGEIKNLNSDHRKVTLLGDYGIDKEGNYFCYTKVGWQPINPDKYEANFFKKKYKELFMKKDL